jgi:hypothetical protein
LHSYSLDAQQADSQADEMNRRLLILVTGSAMQNKMRSTQTGIGTNTTISLAIELIIRVL